MMDCVVVEAPFWTRPAALISPLLILQNKLVSQVGSESNPVLQMLKRILNFRCGYR
jgi:hypothetical protein